MRTQIVALTLALFTTGCLHVTPVTKRTTTVYRVNGGYIICYNYFNKPYDIDVVEVVNSKMVIVKLWYDSKGKLWAYDFRFKKKAKLPYFEIMEPDGTKVIIMPNREKELLVTQ